jgi:hypothetical protein
MYRTFRTRLYVGKAFSLGKLAAPAADPATVDCPHPTNAYDGDSFALCGFYAQQDLSFLLRFKPTALYLSQEPPLVFFLKIATSTASSASARSFSSRSCFRASYCSAVTVFFLPPVERPTAQLASPVSEYGLNRRHKALHDVKSQLPVYLSSGLKEIFETFSLVINTVVSFFHLNLHSWYTPLLPTAPAPTPVALLAPSVAAGLAIIPCSVIHYQLLGHKFRNCGVIII